MIELLNLPLLGGLAAMAAPVLIHIAHRRKFKIVDWGAMQFLHTMMAKSRRRLLIDQWLLLATRMLILGLLALALTRPAMRRTEQAAGQGAITRLGRTSAVLLIDDSASTAAGRSQPAIEKVKTLATAYLDSLQLGDEVSILLMSRMGAAPADPLFDLDAAKGMVVNLEPTAIASDIPALLDAGLAQLARHINPGAEVVLVTDGRSDGWQVAQTMKWEETRKRLRGPEDEREGSRQRPRLMLLTAEPEEVDSNLAIAAVRVDRALIPQKRTVGVRVTLAHQGKREPKGALLWLYVNGQVVDQKPLEIPAGSQQEIGFLHSFDEPGSYLIEAAIEGAHDAFPIDDRRALSVEVTKSLDVLLVQGDYEQGLDRGLGFLAAALDPDGSGSGLFRVTRITAAELKPETLSNYRALVLGDVPALDAASVAALERFVVAGGGILVGLGPKTDVELINRFWARDGAGFLPSPLGALQQPGPPASAATTRLSHPVFGAFSAESAKAWKQARVRRYFRLALPAESEGSVATLMALDNGDPLLVERARGRGQVALLTTSLNADWSDLPLQAAYVPLVRGLVGYLGSVVLPPRNLTPGERLTCRAGQKGTEPTLVGESPSGESIPLSRSMWEGQAALVSEPLLQPGGYRVRDTLGKESIYFAVALSPEESRLSPLADSDLSAALEGLTTHRFRSPNEVTSALRDEGRGSVELWRWLLTASLLLLFAETLLTRYQHYAASRRVSDIGTTQPSASGAP